MKTFLKKLWSRLDSNKTIIGLVLLQIFTTVIILIEPWNSIVLGIIVSWTGLSAYNHVVVKKSFSSNSV